MILEQPAGRERLVVVVRVSPGSAVPGADGRCDDGSYRIRLRSRPVENLANAELVEFLSSEFGAPRSSIRILRGIRGRIKTVEIRGTSRVPDWFRADAR